MKATRFSAAVILLSIAASLLACGETPSPDKPGQDTAADTVGTQEEEHELTETEIRLQIPDNLPETDMNGYKFRVTMRSRSDFVADCGIDMEQTGEVVDDAIYARNAVIAERFNCQLVANIMPDGSDFNSNVVKSITSGDDAMDLALGQVISMPALATEGYFLDWYDELPHVDLTRPWYIGNAAEAMSVGGHAYTMIGEYDLDVLRFTYCMYFNKNIAENYDLENLYEVVNNGKWTYDYLLKLANDIYVDTNGDSKKSEADLLCISGDPYSAVVTYQYAFNNPLFTHNADGIPELTLNTEKAHDIVVKLNDLYWNAPGGYTEGWGTGSDAWENGNLLFYTALFQSSKYFRDLKFDFGIIPYPKYDEAQSQYYTMSDGAHACMAVPITISNPEYTSIIVEALNAETYKRVVPAYYDTALKVKYARDDESVRMLDLLMQSRVFDFGYMYNTGLAFVIQNMVSKNSNNTESSYASSIKQTNKQIGKIIEAYEKMN